MQYNTSDQYRPGHFTIYPNVIHYLKVVFHFTIVTRETVICLLDLVYMLANINKIRGIEVYHSSVLSRVATAL